MSRICELVMVAWTLGAAGLSICSVCETVRRGEMRWGWGDEVRRGELRDFALFPANVLGWRIGCDAGGDGQVVAARGVM